MNILVLYQFNCHGFPPRILEYLAHPYINCLRKEFPVQNGELSMRARELLHDNNVAFPSNIHKIQIAKEKCNACHSIQNENSS